MVLPVRQHLPGVHKHLLPLFTQCAAEILQRKAAFELLQAVRVHGGDKALIELAVGPVLPDIHHKPPLQIDEFERIPAQIQADDHGKYIGYGSHQHLALLKLFPLRLLLSQLFHRNVVEGGDENLLSILVQNPLRDAGGPKQAAVRAHHPALKRNFPAGAYGLPEEVRRPFIVLQVQNFFQTPHLRTVSRAVDGSV